MQQRTKVAVGLVLGLMVALAGCTGTQQSGSTADEAGQGATQTIGFDDHNITCIVYNEYGGQGNDNAIDCTHDTSPAPYNDNLAQSITVVEQTEDTTCVLYDEYGGQGNDNDISCVNTPSS